MVIRSCTSGDVATVAALHAGSWQAVYRGIMRDAFLDGPLLQNRMAEWTANFAVPNLADRGIFLAMDGDQAVGFANAIPARNSAWGLFLDNLHLRPERRGEGLGAALMAHVAAWGLERGHTALHLLVYEPNAAARRFYARQGGVEVERIAVTSPDGTVIPEIRVAWSKLESLRG